jgi:hypothetical protein
MKDVYAQLQLPVLMLYDSDPYTEFDLLPELMGRNPKWRARKIPNTRGLPHFEQLDAVATALDSFWQEID